ncbi:prepilin-type N-terminal cleavage/methylation domain-containing protein [bacterium]|nr:prepilin-type N-terminal cleavage/methylation domain-containing protein [bacterium]
MNNKKGFTLIELMVVVAIIGILASVAVPQFRRFQGKAKQANAKAELTGIYMTEQTFFTEYNTYHSNLADMGYVPDGFLLNQCPTAATVAVGVVRIYMTGFPAAGGVWPGGVGANCPAAINFPATIVDATGTAIPSPGGAAPTANTFTAGATGFLGGAGNDVWSIDENKSLQNTTSGL